MERFIFHFMDQPPLAVKSDDTSSYLYEDFWKTILEDERYFTDSDRSTLGMIKDSFSLIWQCDFGCVILVKEYTATECIVSFVGLDDTKTFVHSAFTEAPNVRKRECVVEFGLLPSSQIETGRLKFLNNLHGQRRLQKNAYYAFRNAMEVKHDASFSHFINYTCPPNTSFPLVLSAVHAMLVSGLPCGDKEELFNKIVSVYLLSKVEILVNNATSNTYCRRRINRCITAMRELEPYLSPINEEDFQKQVLDRLEYFHKALTNVVPVVDKETTEFSDETVVEAVQSLTTPKFPIIPLIKLKKMNKIQIQSDVKRNLIWSSLSRKSIDQTMTSSSTLSSVQDAFVQMHQLNHYFWRLAVLLHNGPDTASWNIAFMLGRLKWLDTVLAKIAVAVKGDCRVMSSIIRSCKVLAHWICYCLADRIATKKYPVYNDDFAPALDPCDLSYLVLDDKQAIEAVGHVRAYLEKRRASRSKTPFTNTKDTMLLASAVARAMDFPTKFASEIAGAEAFVKERRDKIRARKKQRETLATSLTLAQKNLKGAQLEQDAVKRNMKSTLEAVQQCETTVASYSQKLEALQEKVKDAWSLPKVVAFRLPDEEDLAMSWMFFMFMPEEFQVLCGLLLSSQSQLWDEIPQFDLSDKTNLHNWFNDHLKGDPEIGEQTTNLPLCLWAPSEMLDLSSPTSNTGYRRRSRVFFPNCPMDTLVPIWKDGEDVFAPRDPSVTARMFTETLPKSCDQSKFLQQFVEMIPSKEKENIGIAEGGKKPNWLTREQFFCFTTLRSAPRSQFRSLLHAICHDSLPFDHECVHVLIKQLLFQVGEDEWKMDAFGIDSKGLDALAHALACRAIHLKDSKKFADRLLIFGTVASFFGQFHERCLSCARQFAGIARKWGDDLAEEYKQEAIIPGDVHRNIAKYYAFSLLCYPATSDDESDLLSISELVVLYRHNSMMATFVSEHQSLHLSVTNSMAARIKIVVDLVKGKPQILSKLVNLTRVEQLPDSLNWAPLSCNGEETGCFQAFYEATGSANNNNGRLFSMNLLNGIILINGTTPGVLPPQIVNHQQYRRIFGRRNFEVEQVSFRRYRTRRFFDKTILFDFIVDESDKLQIVEVDTTTSEKLLNILSDSIDLPVIVRETHSHWFSRRFSAIISRGKQYSDRHIFYVSTSEATFYIPKKYQGLSLAGTIEILPNCERLLNGTTPLTTVLSRFEREDFILHYVNAKNAGMASLRYSLARFNLDFEQKNNTLSSVQFRGYKLMKTQTLGRTLPEFCSFLIMQNAKEEKKVLIPDLFFEETYEGDFQLKANTTWHESMRYHVYDIHSRFRSFIAADIEGRLFLASLYTWSSTLLPDPGIGKPGMTIATMLVRHCWKNEPLSELEYQRLIEVSQLSQRDDCCTLKLVCSWVYESSKSVGFLHGNQEPELAVQHFGRSNASARWQYALDLKYAPRLLPHEESILFKIKSPPCNNFVVPDQESELSRFVHGAEAKLKNDYIHQSYSQETPSRRFLLERPNLLSPLGEKIWGDLESSHDTYRSLPTRTLQGLSNPSFDSNCLSHLAKELKNKRQHVENKILSWFQKGDKSIGYRLSMATCQQGKGVAKQDLLVILCDASTLLPYLRYFDKEKVGQQYIRIRDWALLCVLEDKLRRVKYSLDRKPRLVDESWDEQKLISELDCVREWSPDKHPRWLAFEVEQEIQIRPQQYQIAEQLLQYQGSIVQLNMGLGKTRVIVPMLIMEFLCRNNRVRVNVLQPIMKEAFQYYQKALVASSQNIRIATLPFHRDTVPLLNEHHAALISREIYRCSIGLGCLLVTPQHRNSLELKQYDENCAFVPALSEPFVDILDESDAILDTKVQLVYALGKQVPLPDGPRRWLMAEILLRILSRTQNVAIRDNLSKGDMVHTDQTEYGTFPNIRFLRPFKKVQNQFGVALCEELIQVPPRECQWMELVPTGEKGTLLRIMSDPTFDCRDSITDSLLFSSYKSDILAVRGFVAFGLLFHGLEMRYRVDFGLNAKQASTGMEILMAIPYEASDTPKARAEFSQPDMAILYTCISYLREGLSHRQLKRALKDLQNLGPYAQASMYQEWIHHIRNGVPPKQLSKFDNIQKIDVENKIQFEVLYQYMHRSIDVVCFWMNTRLFPSKTFQFPEKRASSAWNLATKSTVGFSGTDDNRFLIPLQVKQIPQASKELQATNGSMIDCIVQCSRAVRVLVEKDGVPLWQIVLEECFLLESDALIDVGGLMAGCSKDDVLHFITTAINTQKFMGFVFFDTISESWTVYEFDSRISLPLHNSSLTETECFVYFDESRCRGSDLKLGDRASAVVTLDAGLTKDKFLQGAARMRKLRPGMQSLVLVGTHEAIVQDMTARDVLQKILDNTVRVVSQELTTFYERGLEYAKFPAPVSEELELDELYGGKSCVYDDFASFIDAQHELHSSQTSKVRAETIEYCKTIGSGMPVHSTKLSQECERELEEQVLCEMEFKYTTQSPFAQEDWDYEKAFTNPQSLFERNIFTPLHSFVGTHLLANNTGAEQISAIKWSPKLYCTSNFFKTISSCGPSDDLSNYLRLVNAMLVLQDGSVVLISAYELDKLLPYWWRSSPQRKRLRESGKKTTASLQHLFQYDGDSLKPNLKLGSEEIEICAAVLASIKLFSGRVKFSDNELRELKKAFCNVRDRQGLILRFLGMRDRVCFFDRSSLDDRQFLTGHEQQQQSGSNEASRGVDADQEEQHDKLEKAGISAEQLQMLQAMGLKIISA